MEQLFLHMNFAQILGLVWGAIWIASMSLKSYKRLNQVWIINNIIGIIHLGMLGAWAGAANCFVNVFRSSLFLAKDWRESNYKYHVLFGLLAAYAILCTFNFENWFDMFALYNSVTTCIAFFLLTGIRGRLLMITGNMSWLIYSLAHHSIGGVLSQVAIIIISIITILRMRRDQISERAVLS